MSDYFSYTTADIVFIDDKFDDTDGLNAAKQKSDGQADNKEMAKEKSDSQGDDKETATDHETIEKSYGQGDDKETATDENTKEKSDDQVITKQITKRMRQKKMMQENKGILQSPVNTMNVSTQATKVTKSMCIMTKVGPRAEMTKIFSVIYAAKNSTRKLE